MEAVRESRGKGGQICVREVRSTCELRVFVRLPFLNSLFSVPSSLSLKLAVSPTRPSLLPPPGKHRCKKSECVRVGCGRSVCLPNKSQL